MVALGDFERNNLLSVVLIVHKFNKLVSVFYNEL